MRAAQIYDARFWRLYLCTVLASAAVTSLAVGLFTTGNVTASDQLWLASRLTMLGVSVGMIAGLAPALLVWALIWRVPAGWPLTQRARAVLGAVLIALGVPLMLAALNRLVPQAEAIAGMLMIFSLFGLPASLIIGPALAAWIYKDAP